MKIPQTKLTVSRVFPDAIEPYMRFQFGYHEQRAERVPVFKSPSSKTIIGFKDGQQVSVFALCGHGSTVEKAAKMAGVSLVKEGV